MSKTFASRKSAQFFSILSPKFFALRFSLGRLFFVLVVFAVTAQAQVAQDVINQQDWISRNQQNILEEKKREVEFEAIKKERQRKKKEEAEEKARSLQPKVSGKTSTCIIIKEINFINADSLSPTTKNKLASPFIDKCMEAQVLSDIIKSINNYYHEHGYITTQIKVPKQNLQSGIFAVEIIEGKISEISLGKNGVREKMQKFSAFGNYAGDTLNIKDINQGIYQINRLRSNQAVMRVTPGEIDGESNIIIDNNKKFPARFTIGKDNLGNDFTGVSRTNFSSNFDNIFSLNDNLNLSYTANLNDNHHLKNSKSFASSFAVPFKYNTFTFDHYNSQFMGQNPNATALSGFSKQNKFTLDRVFLNEKNLRFSGSASITTKESASYLAGDLITTSQRRLSIANMSFSISSYLNDTTNIYLKPSYSKGIKILNAKKDSPDSSASTPKAQFEVFKLYGNFSKKFNFFKSSKAATYIAEFDSQFSKQTLFGSEQFAVGGYYSVRGFRENYITGDSGYYLRNKINIGLRELLPTKINSSHLNKFQLEPFFDYGYVRNKFNGADGRLSGAGIKTIFNSRYFNTSLTYSRQLGKSRLITSPHKENNLLYFEVNASCC